MPGLNIVNQSPEAQAAEKIRKLTGKYKKGAAAAAGSTKANVKVGTHHAVYFPGDRESGPLVYIAKITKTIGTPKPPALIQAGGAASSPPQRGTGISVGMVDEGKPRARVEYQYIGPPVEITQKKKLKKGPNGVTPFVETLLWVYTNRSDDSSSD
eukprot:gene25242-16274_t